MDFNLATAIRAMQAIGAASLQLPAVVSMVNTAIKALSADDQPAAKEAYHDLIADNADGHARVQAKLNEAAKR